MIHILISDCMDFDRGWAVCHSWLRPVTLLWCIPHARSLNRPISHHSLVSALYLASFEAWLSTMIQCCKTSERASENITESYERSSLSLCYWYFRIVYNGCIVTFYFKLSCAQILTMLVVHLREKLNLFSVSVTSDFLIILKISSIANSMKWCSRKDYGVFRIE